MFLISTEVLYWKYSALLWVLLLLIPYSYTYICITLSTSRCLYDTSCYCTPTSQIENLLSFFVMAHYLRICLLSNTPCGRTCWFSRESGNYCPKSLENWRRFLDKAISLISFQWRKLKFIYAYTLVLNKSSYIHRSGIRDTYVFRIVRCM